MLMHDALQLLAHEPQLRHLSVSIRIFIMENRDIAPSSVPTGHIVLQYVRPLRHASVTTVSNVAMAMMNVGMLFIHTSVV